MAEDTKVTVAPEQKAAPDVVVAPAPVDASVYEQRAAAAESALKKLQDEVASTSKRAGEDKLRADGKLQELLDKKQAELDALQAHAAIGREYSERETKRIDEAVAKLPESQQRLINAQASVGLKADLLQELSGSTSLSGTNRGEPAPKNQGGAAGVSSIDFEDAFKDPAKWGAVLRRDEKGAREWFAKQAQGQNQPVSFQRQRPKG